jgi:hypothetical protein
MTMLKLLVDSTGRSEEEVLLGLAAGVALAAAVAALRAADSLLEVWPLPLPGRTTRG